MREGGKAKIGGVSPTWSAGAGLRSGPVPVLHETKWRKDGETDFWLAGERQCNCLSPQMDMQNRVSGLFFGRPMEGRLRKGQLHECAETLSPLPSAE